MADSLLSNIYYNPSKSGSFGGVEQLYKEAKKINSNIKRKDVKDWLVGQITYTLHKSTRKKFTRNPIVAENVNQNFQADLVDMREFSKYNDNYSYILTVIDVFSKKAFAKAIKTKSANEVAVALEKIIKDNPPIKLQTDNGTEFKNNIFKNLMKKYKINHFTTNNEAIKCAIVERFNKTLKNKMFRYFTSKGNRRYVDVLDSLLDSYNNSYHRSIKTTPVSVNEINSRLIFKNLYGFNSKRDMLRKYKKPNIKIGTSARQKYKIGPLDRGYYPNWTDNIYNIKNSVSSLRKPLYKLTDEKNKLLRKRYYPEEIQIIKNNNIFRVEKILATKYINKVKHYKVKWLNHPSSYNSWIPAKDIQNIDGEK
jgi:hypothetical protein